MFDAFNRRDRARWLGFVHDDAEIVPFRAALEDVVYRGPDAAKRFWDAGEEVWEGLNVQLEEVRETGDTALAVGRLRAIARTTGAPVEARIGLVFRLEHGKLRSGRTYLDPDAAREAFEKAARTGL